MPEFSAQFLAQATGGQWVALPVSSLFGFHFDTRKLRKGDVFVALKTEQRDGHDFLAAALAAGASAALVARPDASIPLPQLVVGDPLTAFQAIAREHRRAFRGKVVGISGSAGKTSTKDLLALLLGGASCGVVATEGNLNNHIGVPLTLTRIDPVEHRFAVIEAGISVVGEMQPLAEMIEPDVAIITLIAAAHTEELGGIDGVAREKALLPAATRTSGVAIFAQPTAEFGAFRELGVRKMVVERAEVVRPAEPPKDTVYFAVSHRGAETAVSLAYGVPPPLSFTFRRVTDGQAQNAALAICAALWLGVSRDLIQQRLASWKPGKLRGEIREENGRLLYLDCYNANPASMDDALRTFEAVAPAREPRLYLLGCMAELGPEAPAYHRALGRSLNLRENDFVMIIGDNAHDVFAGVIERGEFTRQIQIVATLEPMSSTFAEWHGAVFLKGSRRYQLEKVLEAQTSLSLPC
ncbi:MAG: UDP-N-acetylmuramoyl-tripeptide--D-alanyl-D-alanine ligase [Verrucomicrobiota bacterium]